MKDDLVNKSGDLVNDLVNDCISRAAALKGLEDLNIASFYEENEYSKEAYTETKAMLKALPPTQPTLYGYDIKILAFVASVMAKEGMSPEEAVTTFRDINRVIEIMLEDMKEMQENAFKRPWEGGQDGRPDGPEGNV